MREKDLVQELEEILEDHQPTSQPLINIIGDHNTVVIGGAQGRPRPDPGRHHRPRAAARANPQDRINDP